MNTLIILFVGAIIVLFAGLFSQRKNLLPITIIVLLGSLASSILNLNTPTPPIFASMLRFDNYAIVCSNIAIVATILIVLLSGWAFRHQTHSLGDHYALMLFVLCGALCMVSFNNLTMLFLGIEILSIPLYVLAGSRKNDLHSNEAALKYFIMGAFATGFLLMGITLIYGASGSFDIATIKNFTVQNPQNSVLLNVGVLLLVVAMCFKIGAVPFHFWSPDVYQGAPTLVTTFMATVVKIAAFGAFYRLFSLAFVAIMPVWSGAIAVVSMVTMLVANLIAVQQTSIKRMLAYSSVSHAGYLLMTLLSVNQTGASTAVLVYLYAYSVATICVFAVYIAVSQSSDFVGVEAFVGLGTKKPLLAACATIAMLSLAGIPPTAGFFGKYLIFSQTLNNYTWLVVAAIISSAISIYYYLRIVTAMYFSDEPASDYRIEVPSVYKVVMVFCVLLMIAIGFLPDTLANILK